VRKGVTEQIAGARTFGGADPISRYTRSAFMQLVIAEKPSVARDLARVLGLRATGQNAIVGKDRVITWCIGHLVELEEPAAYDARWKSWRMDTLPMLPAVFKLRAVARTGDQLQVVRAHLRDRRFTEVVNACDAGREGELIFRYVHEWSGSRLPVRRLWISSLTDEAIRQGFAALRPGSDYDALGDAARCRSEADWVVGMNATRAVTLQFRALDGTPAAIPSGQETRLGPADPRGRFAKPERSSRRKGPPSSSSSSSWGARGAGRGALPPVYSIGRVQTPTLAILVRREQAIAAFKPEDYWEVRGTFRAVAPAASASATSFAASWFVKRPGDKKAATQFHARQLADEIVVRTTAHGSAALPTGPVVEHLTQKQTRESPPALFDLTSLQRTANRRYGMSATQTLEAAQALYERHKVLTYPRTDARHLPLDQAAELPRLFGGLRKHEEYAAFVAPLLSELEEPGAASRFARLKRVFDDSKVHDHHAIIPTGKLPSPGALGKDEQRLFDLVVRRFVGAFYPDATFALTEAVLRVGSDQASQPSQPGSARSRALPSEPPADDSADPAADAALRLKELPPAPDRFVARGKVRLAAGWQAVAGLDPDSEATLPTLATGQRLDGKFETLARQTRPPPHHTEATLLGAMEYAGREIEDEELRAAMKDTGLGTPATRAATIETLLKRGFIAREGKSVRATPTGIGLIERLPVPTLASPELTGAWEARLARIARGQDSRTAFMTDITRTVEEMTATLREGLGSAASRARPAVSVEPRRPTSTSTPIQTRTRTPTPTPTPTTPPKTMRGREPGRRAPNRTPTSVDRASAVPEVLTCPRCQQGTLIAGHRGWGCSHWRDGCAFVIWFRVEGRTLTPTQLRELVTKGKTRKTKGTAPSGNAVVAGRLVLDVSAPRERGGARFQPES